jgi:hypothetical protein
VEIYTPKNDMLRVSDGKWEVNHTIRSTAGRAAIRSA